MKPQLSAILAKDNPWIEGRETIARWTARMLPEKFIPRIQAQEQVKRWNQVNKAHLVIGPRQAGKSTTIWNYLHELGEQVLYIDCQQGPVQDWCQSAPLFAADLDEGLPKIPILFFEEVQHLQEAGLFIKGLVDRKLGVPILVTGSSAYHLRAKTRESLAGRASRARILPFSFEEIAQEAYTSPMAKQLEIKKLIARHMIYGGYPEVCLSDVPEVILTDLVESFVVRDASDFSSIQRPDVFRSLLSLAAQQVGSLVNISEWAQVLRASRETAYSYIEILESAHILGMLRPFAGGKRSELTRSPKIYWLDLGLRNRVLADFRPLQQRQDMGPLLENWVYTEIEKTRPSLARLFFWRSKSGAEVDFILADGQRLLAIEVKSSHSSGKKIPRSLRSFLSAYKPTAVCIVSLNMEDEEIQEGDLVDLVHPTKLAEWIRLKL